MQLTQPDRKDYPQLKTLLQSNQLPADDIDNPAISFLVNMDRELIIGCGALELLDGCCLLRSVAVDVHHRSKGVAGKLVSALLAKARADDLGEIYLLTIDAAAYFRRRGFDSIDRDSAPEQIKISKQFSELCPGTAILMRYATD